MRSSDDVFDHIDIMRGAASLDELTKAFTAALAEDHLLAVSVAGFPQAGRDHVIRYNGSRIDAWVAHYDDNRLVEHCPLAARLQEQSRPFLWETVRAAVTDPAARDVLDRAADHGVSHGLVVPVHMRSGDKGCVCVLREVGEADLAAMPEQVMLAQAFHGEFERLEADRAVAHLALSPRERDVLRWFSLGKSAEDVADIMCISSATVMFHYRNVANRLGTLNRTHTVVQALRSGALD